MPGIVREPGILDTTLADTQVLFNGTPVPLLSAQYNRINVQAPYELAGRNSAQVEIRKGGVLKTRLVTAGAGQTAASNEDGTANSLGNPALRGSIVTMFATGEGQTRPVGISLALEPRPFNLRPGPQRARWE